MNKILRMAVMARLVAVAILVWQGSRTDAVAQANWEETREMMRQQGFKTDLADFDFSTSPESRQREDLLKAPFEGGQIEPPEDLPVLMETVGSNSAIVVWQQAAPKRENSSGPDNNISFTWEALDEALSPLQASLDAADAAVLSGPIAFNLTAQDGAAMLLPHLSTLKQFTQTLGSRTVLALHDGNLVTAWTNLMTATRLVTAWEPEPAEVSHLVRYEDTQLAYNIIWQALQSHAWPDEKLAQLQQQWEAADFFKNLTETVAFKRACMLAECQHDSSDEQIRQAVLLFYRNREVELHQAVQAPTWLQMRGLPGVTNRIFLSTKYHSPALARMLVHERTADLLNRGHGFLGRAAEAEACRRIIITALALERYHGKYGRYPQTPDRLAPEFLKTAPVDFMDGHPLRYRLYDDGHFTLYSVGLDCVDHGGIIRQNEPRQEFSDDGEPVAAPPAPPIVWPLPATTAAVADLRQAQRDARLKKAGEIVDQQANYQWEHTARDQTNVDELLAAPAPETDPAPDYHGLPLADVLRNPRTAGTSWPTLSQMLTLRQISTGGEPETVTFEVPIAYEALTNLGGLCLIVDTNNDDSDDGSLAQQMECHRADNGDCLLVWSTIYESPGKHALQMGLDVAGWPTNLFTGPRLPFVITNFCQFSLASGHFDQDSGSLLHAKLPEANARYVIELNTVTGTRLKTITGITANGIIREHWDLVDDHGRRFANDFFNTVFHITLPDSGRTQTMRGP